jgi:XTP/dITP diphosphohydrolase
VKLCFATNNSHKLEEVSAAVGSFFQILSLRDLSINEELPETQSTLQGNALQKAQYVFDKTGAPCFADDSGLEVNALGGEPGVFSARYAGLHKSDADNVELLLKNLDGHSDRSARFRTVIALVGFGKPLFFEGIVSGRIIEKRRGNGGFGYDPVFMPDSFDQTFAEMTMAAKNKISHRAIAVSKLVAHLRTIQIS